MVTDRFTPAYRTLVIATKSRSRYWDGDAVRTEHKPHTLNYPRESDHYSHDGYAPETRGDNGARNSAPVNSAGAPLLDWWQIPDWRVPVTKAMLPDRVCTVCGQPSRRIVAQSDGYAIARAIRNEQYANGEPAK